MNLFTTRLPAARRRFRRFAAILGLLLIGALVALSTARAHGYIIRAIPDNGAVLERAPSRIQAWFSERLEARFSALSLADERGNPIPLENAGVVAGNTSQLAARIPVVLPDGAYVITMRVAFASDGHVFNERIIFWVGQRGGDLRIDGDARLALPLEIVWRALTLAGLSVLFGGALLYQVVLLPAWGNPKYRAGRLPPRVMRRLNIVAWGGVITAVLATGIAIVQQAAVSFGIDPLTVIRDGSWSVVLNGTQIGDTLRARLMFVGLTAGLLFGAGYVAERAAFLVAPLWTSAMFSAALALGTISLSSHAAGADLWLLPSIFVHWLHVLANSAWIGGLAVLTIVLPAALSPLEASGAQTALNVALRRFAGFGAVAVALMAATGFYNSTLQIRQPTDMLNTAYGLTLLVKFVLIAPLLGLALYHHTQRADDWLARRTRDLAGRLQGRSLAANRSLRLETLIGLGVLIVAGALAATPPPIPAQAGEARPGAPARQVTLGDSRGLPDAQIDVQITIDPGAAGANAYEVRLAQHGQPLSGAGVWARFVMPELDRRTAPLRLDDTGEGVYLLAGAELDRAGAWQILLDIALLADTDPPQTALRAAFAWDVPETPSAFYVRSASILNAAAALGVFGVFGAWLLPGTIRRVRALPLHPGSVVIGVALLIVTIIALVAGTWIIASSLAQTDRLRNPPPAVINPTLADAQSLARGKAVFNASCAVCHAPDQRPAFQYTLANRRDEQIYRVVRRGIGKMEALDLDDAALWDVINFLRGPDFYAQ